jgi:CBS domain-containing protein
MLYRALARMDRLGIRHLAVLDGAGRAAGMVSQRDLLHHRARAAEILGDALVEAQSGAELAAAYARVPDVARRLVHEGLAGAEVARVVTSELRALTARAAELSIEAMREAGEGEPPARWCLMVLGSGGRGESLLGADQDNALIHDGSIDDDNWFERFGARLNEMLDLAGLPLCTGEIMVRTAQWRGNRAQWRERVEGWLDSGRPRDLLNVDVFFDLVAVAGDAELARELHDQAVRAASESPPFMALLADYTVRLAPRLALFGRLRVEDDRFNAKRDGLLPLVSTARTLAVRIGSRIVATPERLRAAQVAGRLSEGDCEALLMLHDRLLGLVLHQQLEDLAEGRRASGKIAMSSLSRGERRELARLVRHLDSVVGSLRSAVSPGS